MRPYNVVGGVSVAVGMSLAIARGARCDGLTMPLSFARIGFRSCDGKSFGRFLQQRANDDRMVPCGERGLFDTFADAPALGGGHELVVIVPALEKHDEVAFVVGDPHRVEEARVALGCFTWTRNGTFGQIYRRNVHGSGVVRIPTNKAYDQRGRMSPMAQSGFVPHATPLDAMVTRAYQATSFTVRAVTEATDVRAAARRVAWWDASPPAGHSGGV